MKAAKLALDTGQIEASIKAYQWLLEHMPADSGVTVMDPSVNNKKIDSGPKGPQIKIGIALGGISQPKQLPDTTVIDVLPDVTEEPCQTSKNVTPPLPVSTSSPQTPTPVPTVVEPPSSLTAKSSTARRKNKQNITPESSPTSSSGAVEAQVSPSVADGTPTCAPSPTPASNTVFSVGPIQNSKNRIS